MPRVPFRFRDTYIYGTDGKTIIGGLLASTGITNANLYLIVELFCTFSEFYQLQHKTVEGAFKIVEKDENQLKTGDYYIVTDGTVTVTKKTPLVDKPAEGKGYREASFQKAVRERDGRCVISGLPALLGSQGNWASFEAAHIYPAAYLNEWVESKMCQNVTLPFEQAGSINSPENGMLLSSQIHALFDDLQISILPEDGHKVICLGPTAALLGLGGRYLDAQFFASTPRPAAGLLSWQFEQAVLAHVKGP